jgi:hypothetical protein
MFSQGPSKLDTTGLPAGCAPIAEDIVRTKHKHLLAMMENLLGGKNPVMAGEDEAFPCQFVEMLVKNNDPSVVTSLLMCLGSAFVQQNAMDGLVALDEIISNSNKEEIAQILNWLQNVSTGDDLPQLSMEWASALIQAYAHISRVSRAVRLFE